MKLSIYTYAKNCKNISEIQEGISEIYKYIERKRIENKPIPHYYYSRLKKLEDKLSKFRKKQINEASQSSPIKKIRKYRAPLGYLTTKQTCNILGITYSTLYRMIAEGEFSEDETIRFRGKRIFKESAIYNYIEKLKAISSSK